jgi:RimJ/RimL family protein N-acetyltransferase
MELPIRLSCDDRLELRRFEVADAPALSDAVMESLAALRSWMGWAKNEPRTPEQREGLILTSHAEWKTGTRFGYGIFREGRVTGACSLIARVGRGGLEIAYWVRTSAAGQGVATEASRALTTAAFAAGADFVEIHHDEANTASRRVPEKLGYELVETRTYEGDAPADSGRLAVWRITSDGWARRDGTAVSAKRPE